MDNGVPWRQQCRANMRLGPTTLTEATARSVGAVFIGAAISRLLPAGSVLATGTPPHPHAHLCAETHTAANACSIKHFPVIMSGSHSHNLGGIAPVGSKTLSEELGGASRRAFRPNPQLAVWKAKRGDASLKCGLNMQVRQGGS